MTAGDQPKPGRPTLATPELIEKACSLLARGLHLEEVADRCGIHPETLRLWRRDESAWFFGPLKEAEDKAEDRWLQAVESGDDKWQSRAWLLERRFRSRWGRNDKVEVRGQLIQLPIADLPREAREALLVEALRKERGE